VRTAEKSQFLSLLSKDLAADLLAYITPFLMFILLFAPDVSFYAPITMVGILVQRSAFKDRRILHDNRYWYLGFMLYFFGVVVNVNESLSNGLFLLTVCFMLALLSESIELPASTLYTNIMIGLSLTHELLLCIFTEFSTGSVLIFIVLGMLMDRVMLEKDTQTMAVLFGCFVGVHAVGWTLSGEPFANTAFEIDEIVQNWIKFISAPILGVLLFYAARFSLETLNHGEDKILEES